MTSSAGRPWDGIDLWGPHKQFRETLSEAEESEFDDYLDGAREADLEDRRAEIEDELPEIDLDQPIPDDQFHTLPEADLDRVVDWQHDQDILREERERDASAQEFAEAMQQAAGPPPPLTAQQRFEIGFATTGLITPEMREWEIAADQALSAQFGQPVVGQWVFGLSDPLLLSAGEALPEGAEVVGPAGDDYDPGDRMIRIPTARRKYRIRDDGKFIGQFAYDEQQAVSLLYVSFYQNAGTHNLPVAYGILADVSTDRIFNVSTSRASKDVMDLVRADHNGGLWHDDDLSRPDQRWIAAEPQSLEEAMEFMAQRLVAKGLVADWVHDPDHPLNPSARAMRRNLFRPVEDWAPDAVPGGAAPSATPPDAGPAEDGAEPELTPEEKRAYNEQRIDEMIETVEQDLPPEESWSGIDDEGNPTPSSEEPDSSDDRDPAPVGAGADQAGGGSFFTRPVVIGTAIAGTALAAIIGFAVFGGGDDAAEVPANSDGPAATAPADDQPAGTTSDQPAQPAPSTEARTPDGQVPALPAGWEAPPPFDRAVTDVEDPTVRWSSGGALWVWNVWQEPELISELEEVDADFAVSQLTTIPAGTAIPNELVISVDCSSDPCTYSTIQGAVAGDVDRRVTVPLALNGLELTGSYVPAPAATPSAADQACSRSGTYRLEVTDLTVINDRLVPDFIRGERTLQTTCRQGGADGPIEYVLNETIEIHGRYLFRGSFADQQ